MKNIELISRINLNVSESYKKKICQRNVKKIELEEIKYSKEDMDYNLDENTIYIVDEGIIIYIENDGFKLYYFKENATKYICTPLHEIVIKKDKCKEENSFTNKPSIDKYKVDFNETCWECGSQLDAYGNCSVCGCSKEIF